MKLNKSPDALRTIGEVSEELGIASHVLRFWEGKFNQIKPQKRRGRRYYRPEDIAIVITVKSLLHDEGYTIKGAQKFFADKKNLAKNTTSQKPTPKFSTDLFGNSIDNNAEEVIAVDKTLGNASIANIDLSQLIEIKESLIASKEKLESF